MIDSGNSLIRRTATGARRRAKRKQKTAIGLHQANLAAPICQTGVGLYSSFNREPEAYAGSHGAYHPRHTHACGGC